MVRSWKFEPLRLGLHVWRRGLGKTEHARDRIAGQRRIRKLQRRIRKLPGPRIRKLAAPRIRKLATPRIRKLQRQIRKLPGPRIRKLRRNCPDSETSPNSDSQTPRPEFEKVETRSWKAWGAPRIWRGRAARAKQFWVHSYQSKAARTESPTDIPETAIYTFIWSDIPDRLWGENLSSDFKSWQELYERGGCQLGTTIACRALGSEV